MNSLRNSLVALALVVGGLSGVQAQEPNDASVDAPSSATDYLTKAQAMESQASALSARLLSMLEGARKEGDIIKVTCLNEVLTQANANLRGMQTHIGSLRRAVDSGDSGRAKHEFTVLQVLGQKSETLGRSANQCIGQDLFEPGAASVVTETDSSVVPQPGGADPTSPGVLPPPPPTVTVPPPISPVD